MINITTFVSIETILMKSLKITAIIVFSLFLSACNSSDENLWDTKISTPEEVVKIIDLSETYFDKNVTDEQFKRQYPWFQGSVSDSLFSARRTDANALQIYNDIKKSTQNISLEKEIADVFRRIKMYFPQYESPKVYTYSSDGQMYLDPIIYNPEEKVLFIDLSCFLGENHAAYTDIENYLKKSMTPAHIIPKMAEAVARTMVPFHREEQKFVELMIYEGKVKVLQEAFCPTLPAHLRMYLTESQYQWTKENEANIWNYFIEKDVLFSEDQKLAERFISQAPFSKFYSEIDKEASPQVGVFVGKSICDQYLHKNAKDLPHFLSKKTQEIFNDSQYRP